MNRDKVRRPSWMEARRSPGQQVALGVFALIVVLAPLLFGAVDRLPQIALLALLVVGIVAQPPAVVPLSRWGNRLAIALVALVLIKEFAPSKWFGETLWRTALTREFSLDLPLTHNPEPARALDALLTGVVGIVWFIWVRRLAAERENRPALAWSLFASVAIVAAVSFATWSSDPKAIFGLRYTPGWSGFGPFPNRNHSAAFFAMGAVLGCGCLTWAALQKRWIILAAGGLLLGLVVVALLTTESRGGLIACGIGLSGYLVLCLCKVRNRRAVGAVVAAALVFGALALSFGAQVFSRFHSRTAGEVSNLTRLEIWRDTIGMWKDAPLLGHGLNTFTQIFPLYQRIELENELVLHPESSWLQWLTELGAIPVLLAIAAAVLFLGAHLRDSFFRNRSFFLRAGGFAAGAVLLSHALFDVPAHRWGTAGFALAALAVACPMRIERRRVIESRRTALVPLGIAIFWVLPLVRDVPAWSPLLQIRLLTRSAIPGNVQLAELQNALRYFPLDPELHQDVGLRQLRMFGLTKPADWQREFAIAARLAPSSWYLSSAQARACQRISPALALGYWRQAIDRGGLHREDVLRSAVEETARSPLAQAAWGSYVTTHPELLLSYAQMVPEPEAAYYYALWWKDRALTADLSPGEIRAFYASAPRWGSRAQFDEWMLRRAAWQKRDFRQWAALLHAWGDNARAWELLAAAVPEPGFPRPIPTVGREQLETRWRLAPKNFVNAQQLALARSRAGETVQSDEIIVAVATGEDAPPWFLQKAAHILARQGRTGEAVTLFLHGR